MTNCVARQLSLSYHRHSDIVMELARDKTKISLIRYNGIVGLRVEVKATTVR